MDVPSASRDAFSRAGEDDAGVTLQMVRQKLVRRNIASTLDISIPALRRRVPHSVDLLRTSNHTWPDAITTTRANCLASQSRPWHDAAIGAPFGLMA